jgi:hypothetical protein
MTEIAFGQVPPEPDRARHGYQLGQIGVYSRQLEDRQADRVREALRSGIPEPSNPFPNPHDPRKVAYDHVAGLFGYPSQAKDLTTLSDYRESVPIAPDDTIIDPSSYASELTNLRGEQLDQYLLVVKRYLVATVGGNEQRYDGLTARQIRNYVVDEKGDIGPLDALPPSPTNKLALYAAWWLVSQQILQSALRRQLKRVEVGRVDHPLVRDADELPLIQPSDIQAVFNGPFVHYNELMSHIQRATNGQVAPLETYQDFRMCLGQADGVSSLTPAQKFLVRYFKPHLPIKGLLAWWSPGAGKTCMAAAVASVNFETADYMTLWVTRGVLDRDLYDSIFGRTQCHLGIVESGAVQEGHGRDARQQLDVLKANTNWIDTVSYEKFGNYCSQDQNKTRSNEYERVYRDKIGATNAAALARDRLHRMFIVLDEAHLLYDTTRRDERRVQPAAIEAAIFNSYATSGDDSCRLLILTASPLVRHPTDFLRLLSLCQADPNARYAPTDGEFDAKYFPTDSKTSIDFVNREVLPKLGRLIFGTVSYLGVTSSSPVFPSFNSVRTIFVPASKPQIAQAVKCSGRTTTADVAKCLKRTDHAIDAVLDLTFDTAWSSVRANANLYRSHLFLFAPKQHALVHAIQRANREDFQNYGHLFKHVVYVDFGADRFVKSLITIFRLFNFSLVTHYGLTGLVLGSARTVRQTTGADGGSEYIHNYHDPRYDPAAENPSVAGPGVTFLLAGSVGGHKVDTKDNKRVLDFFNRASDHERGVEFDQNGVQGLGNEFGEYAQVLIIPKQFKEGFSIFDAKYFWELVPSASIFEGLQAVGRVTRQCGNKNLALRLQRHHRWDLQHAIGVATQMTYTDFRSYLPLRIVAPSAVEKRAARVLDEFNRNDLKTGGFTIPDLSSSHPALNKPNILHADGVFEPGTRRPFEGSQSAWLAALYQLSVKDPQTYERVVRDNGVDVNKLRSMYFQPFYYVGGPAAGESKPSVPPQRPRRRFFADSAPASGLPPVIKQTLAKLQVDDKTLQQFVADYNIKTQWTIDQLYKPLFQLRSHDLVNGLFLSAAAIFSVDYWHNQAVNDPLYAPGSVAAYLTTGPVNVPQPKVQGGSGPAELEPQLVRRNRPGPHAQHTAVAVPDFTGQYSERYKVPELEQAKHQRKQQVLSKRRFQRSQDE